MNEKMRTLLFAFAIAIVMLPVGIAAQSVTPEARVRSFYTWYLHDLNGEHDPIANTTGLKKHVTTRFVGAIQRALKREGGIDADIFIDAQDFDPLWEKNLAVSKAVITGGKATATVTLKGGPNFGTKKLKIGLKKERGVWKIDSVNDRLSP